MRAFLAISFLIVGGLAHAQQIGAIASGGVRPFVTGFTPVIGANGAVGGISVDAKGMLTQSKTRQQETLDELRRIVREPDAELATPTKLRRISLRKLDETLARHLEDGAPIPQEVFFLAGLQRIEYVFVYPEQGDVVIAGPAEGWTVREDGAVVGTESRQPVVRLDDLRQAFGAAMQAPGEPISCSIEPTDEGKKRFAKLTSARGLRFSAATAERFRRTMGDQQVLVRGVATDGHFAHVLVAADYRMKTLAMGLEESPLPELPSYLEMVRDQTKGSMVSSPRWWMEVDYEPLEHSEDRLAWRLSGQGLKTLAEDAKLSRDGVREIREDGSAVSNEWASRMTTQYDKLSESYSVFRSLRNCVDASVVAALIYQRTLLQEAGLKLTVLNNLEHRIGPSWNAPQSVPSSVSYLQARRGYIVTVSGGVEIDPWSALQSPQTDAALGDERERSQPIGDRWWW